MVLPPSGDTAGNHPAPRPQNAPLALPGFPLQPYPLPTSHIQRMWARLVLGVPNHILIYHRPVGHNILLRQAPRLCGSRASRPCATHSRTRHQHRRQHLKHCCDHTRGVFRRTHSDPFPRPPSPNALSPPLHRIVPLSDILFLQGRAADRSRHRALPRCDPYLTVSFFCLVRRPCFHT